jgi:hypothetical protein
MKCTTMTSLVQNLTNEIALAPPVLKVSADADTDFDLTKAK